MKYKTSEILCVIERRSDVNWVMKELRNMVSDSVKLTPTNEEEYVEIWAVPGLSTKEKHRFETLFEDEDYTDVAWLSDS